MELTEFEETIEMAELRAISNYSMENPLTDKQFERMKYLAKKRGM